MVSDAESSHQERESRRDKGKGDAMVSDAELVDRLREFLRISDLNTTTTAIVRRKLESDFGVDLTEKKTFIREEVDRFLGELENEKKEEEEEHEQEEQEENEVKEEEEEEEVEEEEKKKRNKKKSDGASSRKRGSNKVNKEVKKRSGGGFTKICSLSPQLQEFVGVTELPRTEVVRQLWAYIRENDLQDPSNRRKILCDEKLLNLFNVKTIDMFQMNKALTKHIWPLDSEDGGPVKSVQKEKKQKKAREEEESPRKGKRQKAGGSGFLAPLQLSDALVKFIGTGENELPRTDVVKRIWEYIKQNSLQDPGNRKNVICDEKLRELFQVDSFVGFSVAKLLQAHFMKIN